MADNRNHICPWCGAYSPRACEFRGEIDVCPWEESEPDPDILRENRDDIARENSNG